MKHIITALLILLSSCAKSGLELVPEGPTRNLWQSIDDLSRTKNRAGLLLDKARERYYTDKHTMDKVLTINKQTVECTDALPLSNKQTMDAFIADMHRPDRIKPDSYYLQRFADFYLDASTCYSRHNTALEGILKL